MSQLLARPWLGVMSLLLYGLLAMATHVHAAESDYRLGTQGEVLDDRVMYTIGGGSAVGSPSSLYRPSGLGVFYRRHRITAGLLQIALHFLVLGQRAPAGLTDLVRHLLGHGLAGQLGAVEVDTTLHHAVTE